MQVHAPITLTVLIWLLLIECCSANLTAIATVSQRGVTGTIIFTQNTPTSETNIRLTLTGLPPDELYQWHVHQYPFASALPSPCSPPNTGGHFDPLGAFNQANYSTNCNKNNPAACEIGDLSGKFGLLNVSDLPFSEGDDTISLYGRHSIIGRSIVFHFSNGTRFVCANILINSSQDVISRAYSPFRRSSIVGNIYFTQYSFNLTTVFVDLLSPLATQDHNWHVHEDPVTGGDNACSSTAGHYNPRNVNVTNNDYLNNCNESNPFECEVGDLSNKGGTISFSSTSNQGRLFYSDIDLPLLIDSEGHYIENRSIVIHQENRGAPRIACGNLTALKPREAVSVFNGEKGVYGSIKFKQDSPFDPTTVLVNITGLNGTAGGYHVHETPVGEGVTDRSRCGPSYTGGHWNPRNAPYPLPPGLTSDQYEVGDLSGKFELLDGRNELDAEYSDPNIPLFGVDSIIGRSVVIHLAEPGAPRWVCANINYARPTVQVSAAFSFSNNQSFEVVFVQPDDDPYSDTTIFIRNNSFIEPPSPSPSPSPSVTSPTSLSSLPQTSLISSLEFAMSSSLSPSPSPSLLLGSGDGDMMLRKKRFSDSDIMNELLEADDVYMYEENDEMNDQFVNEKEAEHPIMVAKRQIMDLSPISWSVSNLPAQQGGGVACDLFMPILSNSNDTLCMNGVQLGCSGGDLTAKHGPLTVNSNGMIRTVYTDPYLPLSGDNSVLGKGLLVQSDGEGQLAAIQPSDMPALTNATSCIVSTSSTSSISSTTSTAAITLTNTISTSQVTTTSTLSTTSTSAGPSISVVTETPSGVLPFSNTILIIICAGGGGVLLLLLILFLALCIICCKCRRSNRYDKYMKDHIRSAGNIELGKYKRTNPISGVSCYRVLYDYDPQQDGDLELKEGEMVTLLESPLDGDWWCGKLENEKQGWFPKSYVEYVDIVGENKKRQEDSFAVAAATIRVASMAFTSPNTPSTNSKLHKDLKEEESTFIIPNLHTGTPQASPQIARAHTPIKRAPSEATPSPPPSYESPIPPEDIYIAKFDYSPQSDSELKMAQGDRVIIIERADGGWWHGVIGEEHGWFPETFVEPEESSPPMYDEDKKEETKKEEEEEPFRPRGMTEFHKETSDEVEASEYKAVYTYTSDTDGDLKFQEGDTILVYWANPNGWWFGSVDGRQGYFPGSYVEAVMEHTASPNLSGEGLGVIKEESPPSEAGGTSFSDEISNAFKKRKEAAETGGERAAISPVPSSSGSLSDEIANAFKRREERKPGATDSQKSSPALARGGTSGSLEDQLAAAIKKRSTSPPQEPPVVSSGGATGGGGSLEDQLAAALKKRSSSPPAHPIKEKEQVDEKEKEEEKREASGSLGNIQTEIMSMLTSFGGSSESSTVGTDKEKLIKDEEPQATDKKPVKRRQAPPPPKSKSVTSKSPTPASPEPPLQTTPTPTPSNETPKSPDDTQATAIPPVVKATDQTTPTGRRKPPVVPLVVDKPVEATPTNISKTPPIEQKVKTEEPKKQSRTLPPKVVKQLTASPGTKARRAPPPPPSSLATHTKTASVSSDDDKSGQPQNKNKPIALEAAKPTSTSSDSASEKILSSETQEPKAIVQKGSGWKPQTRKGKKQAPRRNPPLPPPTATPTTVAASTQSKNKPKVQIVRRPTARNIPPPPNIPLPAPPKKSPSNIPPPPSTSLPPPPSSPLPPPPTSSLSPPPTSSLSPPPSSPLPPPPSSPLPPPPKQKSSDSDNSERKKSVTRPSRPPLAKQKSTDNSGDPPSVPSHDSDYEKPISTPSKKASADYEEPLPKPLHGYEKIDPSKLVERGSYDKPVPPKETKPAGNEYEEPLPKPRVRTSATKPPQIANQYEEVKSPTKDDDGNNDYEPVRPPTVAELAVTTNPAPPVASRDSNLKPSEPSNPLTGPSPKPKVKPKPAKLLKPKPPVAKKPASLSPSVNKKEENESAEGTAPKPKPRPPKPSPPPRVSSLPSTPQGSPSPTAKRKHSPVPSPLATRSFPVPPKSPSSPLPPTQPSTTPSSAPPTKAERKSSLPPPRPKPPPIRKLSAASAEQTDAGNNKVTSPLSNGPIISNGVKPDKLDQPVPKARRTSGEGSTKASIPARPPPPRSIKKEKKDDDDGGQAQKYYKALKSYTSGGGNGDHLSFSKGDILVVLDDGGAGKEGWVHGMLDDGTTGLFPLSHVTDFQPNQ